MRMITFLEIQAKLHKESLQDKQGAKLDRTLEIWDWRSHGGEIAPKKCGMNSQLTERCVNTQQANRDQRSWSHSHLVNKLEWMLREEKWDTVWLCASKISWINRSSAGALKPQRGRCKHRKPVLLCITEDLELTVGGGEAASLRLLIFVCAKDQYLHGKVQLHNIFNNI